MMMMGRALYEYQSGIKLDRVCTNCDNCKSQSSLVFRGQSVQSTSKISSFTADYLGKDFDKRVSLESTKEKYHKTV